MSRERARRREAREREAAVRAAARAAEAERAERRAARRRALTRHLPTRTRPVRGGLADRRRRQRAALVGVILTVLVLVFAFSESWGLTAFVGVAALLGAPVLHTLMFRR